MTDAAEGTRPGRQMASQLRMVHRPLRSDIVALRDGLQRLRTATTKAGDVERLLGGLTVADLSWQLKAGCQHFCAHLDAHHSLEDAQMLPVMQRRFPELTGEIGRLRREHDEVKTLIVTIRAAARCLDPEDEPSVRELLERVSELADHLQSHLDFEEQALIPYFLRMDRDWHSP